MIFLKSPNLERAIFFCLKEILLFYVVIPAEGLEVKRLAVFSAVAKLAMIGPVDWEAENGEEIDSGWGTNHKTIPGEPQPDFLLSTGPGVRYTLDPYFSARLDWGIKLHQQAVFTGGGSMLHFNATFSY